MFDGESLISSCATQLYVIVGVCGIVFVSFLEFGVCGALHRMKR